MEGGAERAKGFANEEFGMTSLCEAHSAFLFRQIASPNGISSDGSSVIAIKHNLAYGSMDSIGRGGQRLGAELLVLRASNLVFALPNHPLIF